VTGSDGRRGAPVLASLDLPFSDEELAEAARQTAALRRDPAGVERLAREFEGRDASGAVRVRLDGHGRPVDVLVSGRWRDSLSVAALGGALLRAYSMARVEAQRNAALRLGAADDVPAGARQAAPAQPVGEVDAEVWLAGVWRDLEESLAVLDSARRAREDAAERSGRERVVSGPDGLVRVTARGTTVVAVEVDERAASGISPARLAADAMGAFRAAQ
jgi:DNA-binding protein YbaB